MAVLPPARVQFHTDADFGWALVVLGVLAWRFGGHSLIRLAGIAIGIVGVLQVVEAF